MKTNSIHTSRMGRCSRFLSPTVTGTTRYADSAPCHDRDLLGTETRHLPNQHSRPAMEHSRPLAEITAVDHRRYKRASTMSKPVERTGGDREAVSSRRTVPKPRDNLYRQDLLNSRVRQSASIPFLNCTTQVSIAKCLLFVMCMTSLTLPISAWSLDRTHALAQKDDGFTYESPPIDSTTYLSKFGYLPKSHMETGELRDARELTSAVKKFQRMAHLPVSGKLDPATVTKMSQPRCGVTDDIESYFKKDGINRKKRYVLGPSTWPNRDLTYRILNYTPDLQAYETRRALQKAFKVWSDVTQLTFTEVVGGSADLMIRFAYMYHQDGYPFDGPGMTLAHAFFPGPDQGGDVHFDEDETWTVGVEDGVNLFTVAAHEIGHALGLGHSSVLGALMYPWYQGYVADLTLHGDDLVAIQYLYGRGDPVYPPSDRTTTTQRYPVSTRPGPTIPPAFTTRRPEISTTQSWNTDNPPNPCYTDIDAAALVRQEAYLFKGLWFWRLDQRGVMDGYPVKLNRFWYGLPQDVHHIDAVYERKSDGKIVFFSGNRYWVYGGNHIDSGFPESGRPLRDMGFPDDIDHVDAAFVWGHNGRTYFVTGTMYWRYNEELNQMDYDYPRDMSMWDGVPVPVGAAFQFWDGNTYFFKGRNYWKFQDALMRTDYEYPQAVGQFWLECTPDMMERPDIQEPGASGAQAHQCGLSTLILVVICNFAIVSIFKIHVLAS